MYEKEEKDLMLLNKLYEDMHYPVEDIDAAIHAGFQKATQKQKKIVKKRWIFSISAAAVFFISFFISIRFSPVFADYIAQIPGMEKVVEMINFDKGLLAAVENEYIQEIGISKERNGIKVTIDHVIADEYGMVLFYSIEAKDKQKRFQVHELELKSKQGEDPVIATSSFATDLPNDAPSKKVDTSVELFFSKPINTTEFILDLEVGAESVKEQFEIPFSLNKPLKQMKTYKITKTVFIENQEITIKQVDIYPLRAAVTVKMNPDNSKKILSFDDLRLVDEHGEAWTKISNGFTASILNDHEQILYLQSNYFKEPEELYIALNRMQAIDREESAVVIDTKTEEILKQPKGEFLSDLEVNGSEIWFNLKTNKEFNYSLFTSARDAKGKELYYGSMIEGKIENGRQRMGLRLESSNIANPIILEISAYPEWIDGEIKVKVE